MTEICQITKIKSGTPYIRRLSKNECDGCGACAPKGKKSAFPAICKIKVEVGDRVSVEMPVRPIAAVCIYLLPLIFLIAGFYLGGLFNSDLMRFLTAIFSTVLSFVFVYLFDRLIRKNPKFMPVIKSVITIQDKVTLTKIK